MYIRVYLWTVSAHMWTVLYHHHYQCHQPTIRTYSAGHKSLRRGFNAIERVHIINTFAIQVLRVLLYDEMKCRLLWCVNGTKIDVAWSFRITWTLTRYQQLIHLNLVYLIIILLLLDKIKWCVFRAAWCESGA